MNTLIERMKAAGLLPTAEIDTTRMADQVQKSGIEKVKRVQKNSYVTGIEKSYENIAPKKPVKVAGISKPKQPIVAQYDDPRRELRRLVQQHSRWTSEARTMGQMSSPVPLFDEAGKKIPGSKNEDLSKDPVIVSAIQATAKGLQAEASKLERAMYLQLRQCPVYQLFLEKVYGVGPVCAAYIVANVDITRAAKPSQLRRYCGNSTDANGRLERRAFAPKYDGQGELDNTRGGSFNPDMRTAIWLAMVAARKNGAKATRCSAHVPSAKATPAEKVAFRNECAQCKDCQATATPFGTTSKYLDRWADSLHTSRTEPYVNPDGKMTSADKKGRMKAADVFLEDLYIVMRALAGLPVYPTFHTMMRNRQHGSEKPVLNVGVSMTVDEALALVGDPSGRPATRWMFDAAVSEDVSEET
jgi:hypothetical protein